MSKCCQQNVSKYPLQEDNNIFKNTNSKELVQKEITSLPTSVNYDYFYVNSDYILIFLGKLVSV